MFLCHQTPTAEIYTLSLHDALPISRASASANRGGPRRNNPARATRPPTPWRPCPTDRKSTRLNSSHSQISYAVFCLKKKTNKIQASRAVFFLGALLSSTILNLLVLP